MKSLERLGIKITFLGISGNGSSTLARLNLKGNIKNYRFIS
jgi:hypothetical protein